MTHNEEKDVTEIILLEKFDNQLNDYLEIEGSVDYGILIFSMTK